MSWEYFKWVGVGVGPWGIAVVNILFNEFIEAVDGGLDIWVVLQILWFRKGRTIRRAIRCSMDTAQKEEKKPSCLPHTDYQECTLGIQWWTQTVWLCDFPYYYNLNGALHVNKLPICSGVCICSERKMNRHVTIMPGIFATSNNRVLIESLTNGRCYCFLPTSLPNRGCGSPVAKYSNYPDEPSPCPCGLDATRNGHKSLCHY